jgi:hypothetical protein
MGVVAETITLDVVNAVARSLLTFASDMGSEQDMLDLAAQPDQEGLWARPGPTRATSVVACVPAYVTATGEGIAGGAHLDQVGVGGALEHCTGGGGGGAEALLKLALHSPIRRDCGQVLSLLLSPLPVHALTGWPWRHGCVRPLGC